MKHDLTVVVVVVGAMEAFGGAGEEKKKGRPRQVHLLAATPRSCRGSTISGSLRTRAPWATWQCRSFGIHQECQW